MEIVNVLEAKMESGELYPFFSIKKCEEVTEYGKETSYTAMGYGEDVTKVYALNSEGALKFEIKSPSGNHTKVKICRPITDAEWEIHRAEVVDSYSKEALEQAEGRMVRKEGS